MFYDYVAWMHIKQRIVKMVDELSEKTSTKRRKKKNYMYIETGQHFGGSFITDNNPREYSVPKSR